jgi:N-acetylglucosaminyldiphosphoundecaprenol N-acetyl-beta-D-mannosaminyltransferase
MLPPAPPARTTEMFGWSLVAEPFSIWWKQLVTELTQAKTSSPPITIFTPNPEIVMLAQRDSAFQALVARATHLIPDGIGLVWASKWLPTAGAQISERIAGTDVVRKLLKFAETQNWRVLIIGGRGYSVPRLAALPGQVAWMTGYQQIAQPTEAEEKFVASEIARFKPEIIFVALGAPNQEQWTIVHQSVAAKHGVKLIMTVGGAFDFLLGKVARAPKFWQKLGLEWLFRLIQQPWRLRRQLAILSFIWLVLRSRTDPK